MSEAVFHVEGDVARAGPLAAGPWDPGLQHGGAPSALIVWVAEQFPTPEPMPIARLTVDLLRPVPLGELAIESEVVRQGRKIQLLQVRLLAKGVEVARGSVLKVRAARADLPPGVGAAQLDVPGPEAAPIPDMHLANVNAFGSNFDMRNLHGGFGEQGPSATWFRMVRPMVAGHPNSPAMVAAAVADFTNGISSVLDFNHWTFINGDLTVSFARQPVGDWILSNAESWIGPEGCGLAMTRLADEHGYFGRAVQSLVVEAR